MQSDLDTIRAYIRDELGAETGTIDPDTDLLDAAVLDSFSIVQLAMFVQERFGIEFEPEELVRSNLATLSRLVALIEQKRNGR